MAEQDVDSTEIQTISYDESMKTLTIAFKTGESKSYAHVPQLVYQSLMDASSHGMYYHAYIENKYSEA
jgi:hypothetical protein